MKKGQVYEGVVEKTLFPNKGIVTLEDGKQVVVKNAITGQRISFSVNKIRKGRGEGRLLEILERSPLEQEEPVCEHFGICGGCTFLSLSGEEQRKLKEQQVKDLLRPVCAPYYDIEDGIFEGIKESPRQYGYRNKMEFSFGDMEKDGPLTLGMHKRGSFHDIVTVTGCRIVDKDYSLILECVLNYFREKGIPYYHKVRHVGYLRHLLVRKAVKTGEILIDLVTSSWSGVCESEGFRENAGSNPCVCEGTESNPAVSEGTGSSPCVCEGTESNPAVSEGTGSNPCVCEGTGNYSSVWKNTGTGQSEWQSGIKEEELLLGMVQELCDLSLEGKIAGILHTLNDSVADAVINQGTTVLYGQDFFYEELLGLKFKISPFSFFQTNSLGAEVLYETAREYVADSGNDGVIYDLYSGTGTIAQLLAPVAKKVIGVEIVPEAVEAARENAKRNGLDNCEFIAGDVLKVLDGIVEKPDFIVLDPPRDGIHPKALGRIIRYGVERMVYISCKPTSLARDLAVLQERGYRVERICCVDMFPGTGNVETVTLLVRKP